MLTLDFENYNNFCKRLESLEPPVSVIEEILNQQEFLLLTGICKAGKSILSTQMGLSVASGRNFIDYKCNQGGVLYLQTEVSEFNLKERIQKMTSNFTADEIRRVEMNFRISCFRLRIDVEPQLKLLRDQVDIYRPGLIILDPFYELHRKSEDNSSEMAPILAELRSISRDFNCALILVHHQGKAGEGSSKTPGHSGRGSSSLGDVPDAAMSLSIYNETQRCLKGIFRNRKSLEGLSLKLCEETLNFISNGSIPPKKKTREVIISVLQESNEELTLKEITKRVGPYLTDSAIRKQLESMPDVVTFIIKRSTKYYTLKQ